MGGGSLGAGFPGIFKPEDSSSSSSSPPKRFEALYLEPAPNPGRGLGGAATLGLGLKPKPLSSSSSSSSSLKRLAGFFYWTGTGGGGSPGAGALDFGFTENMLSSSSSSSPFSHILGVALGGGGRFICFDMGGGGSYGPDLPPICGKDGAAIFFLTGIKSSSSSYSSRNPATLDAFEVSLA